MMLKKKPSSAAAAAVSLWLRNVQLGIFATPLAAAAMLLNDGEFVAMYGLLQGFDSLVWLIVLLNGLGRLLFAASTSQTRTCHHCHRHDRRCHSRSHRHHPIHHHHPVYHHHPIQHHQVGCSLQRR